SFDRDAEILQDRYHIAARILELIGRRDWEVALLGTELVPEAGAIFVHCVPIGLDGIDLVIAVIGALVVAHFIKDEVLELRPEIGGITNPGALQIGLGL